MANIPQWQAAGDWFDVCSCDIPCPCEFAQPPTRNQCQGVLAYHVREGHFGEIPLDDLSVVALGAFEGNVWAGAKVTLGMFIDDRADERQQGALQTIFAGQAGGWPAAFAELIGDFRAEVRGKVVANAEALSGPTTPPGARVQLLNPPGSEVGPGQIATWGVATADRVDAPEFGMSFEWDGRSSKHIPFDWNGPDE